MPRKIDPTMLDHQIVRRSLHNADSFETCFSEFTTTWQDPMTKNEVEFTGRIDSEIALKTARIQGEGNAYELKKVFTASELRAFNYLMNVEHSARLRNAA